MPKVISRAAISTSNDAEPTASSQGRLIVYYCICGEFVLVIDKSLSKLARRQTDGAIVLRNDNGKDGTRRIYKLNTIPEKQPVFLRRPHSGKIERQQRLRCPRCDLQIGYEIPPIGPPTSAEEEEARRTTASANARNKGKAKELPKLVARKGRFTYILAGALSDVQSAIPEGAFGPEHPGGEGQKMVTSATGGQGTIDGGPGTVVEQETRTANPAEAS